MSHVSSSGNCLIAFAGAVNGYKKPMCAAQLFGAREVIHESIEVDSDAGFQAIYTSQIAQTRTMLDEPDFVSALAEVRATTVREAVEYELEYG